MKKLKALKGFHKVKFVILFGSQTTGKANKMSDYDFAVYFEGDKKERFKFLIKLNSSLSDKFDVKIFQDLPLYVRKEVLKGKIIYTKDRSFVYDVAYQTIEEFEDFKKYYYDYIGVERMK